MKRLVHFIFIVFLYWHTLALATISVQTKPAAIWQGEEFHLIIRLEHNKLDTLPDLSPLGKDFVIIGTETSMVYSIINSKSNIMNQIDLTLIAKKTGDLVIPSLNIGNEYSMPLKINVKESQSLAIPTPPGSTDASNDPIFLESKSDINQAFINQQIIYTVRLYSNQRILNGEYVPPKAEDAIVVPLGSGKSYQTTLNERIYAVEEQRYAIFPQKAGELKIIPPQFNAIILSAVAQQILPWQNPVY